MRGSAALGLVLLHLCGIQAKFMQGQLRTSEDWAFVARFCFLSHYGRFEYSIEYSKEFAYQNLLLYYDSDTQWPSVYKTNKTCDQKQAILKRELLQIVPLRPEEGDSGCVEVAGPGPRRAAPVVLCNSSKSFRSARERWWFLAISHCNSTKGLSLKYTFLMTNGAPGDFWHEHFSADQFYIMPVLMGFSTLYILLLLATFICCKELRSRQLLHSTYKLFSVSVVLQEVGIFVQSIAYMQFAVSGVESIALRDLGRLCESGSEILFLLVLLLLAKGYTVTRGRLRLGSSIKLTVFMCLYTVCYWLLFLYEREYFDPGEVLYIYESPAGYGLIGLRIAAWWMFIYSTIFTLKHYPEKAQFYYPFNLIGTLWFVAGPAFVLCANTFIDKWARESIVCFVHHMIAASGHILFLMLTVPSKANKNFPYHVRTTQIGVMEVTDGTLGNNTLDHFGHHPYAPGGPPLSRPETRNCGYWDQSLSESQTEAVFKFSRPATTNTSDCLIVRPEEILPVPDFTAPSHRNNIYLPS